MNTNSLNLVIDGYGFAILVTGGSATLFDTLDDLKFHASVGDIDLSTYECLWAGKLSPALLAKYGLECGSPTPEQPEGQPHLSTETVDNSTGPFFVFEDNSISIANDPFDYDELHRLKTDPIDWALEQELNP